jgi:hypothetical protein
MTRKAVVGGLYLALAVGAVLGQYLKTAAQPSARYPHYNEYLILKSAFGHLRQHHNLYAWYLPEHWDLYRYSPTFAVGFAPLTVLPDWLGMLMWNLLNAFALFVAIHALPGLTSTAKAAILLCAGVPLVVSLKHFQSNGVMAAFMLLSMALRLREHLLLATLCLVVSGFIKIFGICACVVFVLFPHRTQALLCALLWVLVLACVPLVWLSVSELVWQYACWLTLLQEDHTVSDGLSVLRGLKQWFGIAGHKTLIQAMGVGLLCLPLLNTTAYDKRAFRLGMLSVVLMWVILFNHRAETATLVIAVCGCALGYYTSQQTVLDTGLLLAVVLVTCLAPTDLCPLWLRQEVVKPCALAIVPVLGMWIKRTYDLVWKADTTAHM